MMLFKTFLNIALIFMVIFPFGKIGPAPVKLILLMAMFFFGSLHFLFSRKPLKRGLLMYFLFFAVIFPMIWMLIGLINNVPLSGLLDFANVFPLLLILLFVYLFYEAREFNGLAQTLAMAISFVAGLTIILMVVYLLLPEVDKLILSRFLLPSGLGANISPTEYGFIRIILRSNIFLPINLFLILSFLRYDSRPIWRILLLVNLIAFFIGFNRAFFIGSLLSLLLFIWFQGWFIFKLPIIKNSMIRAMITILLILGLIPFVYQLSKEMLAGVDLTSTSNYIRLEQTEFLTSNIEKAPIIGRGFGAKGINYSESMTLVDYEQSDYFELQYLHLIFQLGFVGFFIFFLFIFAPVSIYFYNYGHFGQNQYYVTSAISAYIGFLFYAGTNPYIMDSSGFLIIIFVYLSLLFSLKYPFIALLAEKRKEAR